MKECNKCDATPRSLFPSAFSCAAASVTTALRKRHMLHFSPLPLHSVTLRVTLSEPRESLSNTGLALSCYTVTRKTQVPLPQSFLCPDRSPPRERFFAAALPCKKRLRVRTRPRGVRAALRGACGKFPRPIPSKPSAAVLTGKGKSAERVSFRARAEANDTKPLLTRASRAPVRHCRSGTAAAHGGFAGRSPDPLRRKVRFARDAQSGIPRLRSLAPQFRTRPATLGSRSANRRREEKGGTP